MNPNDYRRYLLVVLLLIFALNSVDRVALGLALQDIKVDLRLTDTQLGLLSGIAFALFYSVMGIPIARWADRGNRIAIVAISTALFSAAMALSGLASSFVQLLLIRVVVAVGEAGCIPPANSLIPEYFTRRERPRAVAIYYLGGSLGIMAGYFAAGWLNQLYGWRTTFLWVAVPGLTLAVLAWLTLKEPRLEAPVTMRSQDPSLGEVAHTLWAHRTFRRLLWCFSVIAFFGNGILQWQAAFFIRSYGLSTGELGTWFAMLSGLGGVLGAYFGGTWASRYAAGNERLQLAAIALTYCALAFVMASIFVIPNLYIAFGCFGLATFGASAALGPLFATIQTMVPERMRAMSIALIYLFANLIGLGLGPLAAGALSDTLRPWFGEESLRYALLALCPGYLWAGWYLWRARWTVMAELAQPRSPQRPLTV